MLLISRLTKYRWVAVVAVAGCGASATICRPEQESIRGKIVRSDSDAIYIRDRDGRENGRDDLTRIDRRSVADIDHPGNVAMVIGALLLGNFAIFMTGQDFRSELVHGAQGDVSTAARQVTPMFAVPGALLLGSGTYHYVSSKAAARAFEHPDPAAQPRLHPDTPQ